MTIRLNGSDLTVTQVVSVAPHGELVALAAEAITAMRQSRAVVEEVLSKGEPVYGLTTGVGERKAFLLDPAQRQRFNQRLVLNHRIVRCIRHIHGAARDALAYARTILQLELNSSQSNPVVVVSERRIVSVGNFDIGPLAAALDFARIALAPVVTSANERAVKLLQAPYSGLPAGLAAIAGSPDDALSELAVAGQAITVETRRLAHPVSYELASSVKGDGIEDRATMAPLSARRLADMIQLCARVAAIEFVVAAQAIDLRARPVLGGTGLRARPGLGGTGLGQPGLGQPGLGQPGLGTGRAYRMIREFIPFTHGDGTLPADLEPLVTLVTTGTLNPIPAVA